MVAKSSPLTLTPVSYRLYLMSPDTPVCPLTLSLSPVLFTSLYLILLFSNYTYYICLYLLAYSHISPVSAPPVSLSLTSFYSNGIFVNLSYLACHTYNSLFMFPMFMLHTSPTRLCFQDYVTCISLSTLDSLIKLAQSDLICFTNVCLCLLLTHLPACSCLCVSEEKRTAQSVRGRLWELLAPAGLGEGSGSSPWLRDYRHLLQEEGVDEETQRKALLLQLWATQVSHRHSPISPHLSKRSSGLSLSQSNGCPAI